MNKSRQLISLLKSYLEGDEDRFFSLILKMAEQETGQECDKLARELTRMMNKARAGRTNVNPSSKTSSRERGQTLSPPKLVEFSYPKLRFSSLSLEDTIARKLELLIQEQRNFTSIRERGLPLVRKLLLVGPSGSGKTAAARVVAGELGVPLFLVRLERVFGYGEQERIAKLRQIFKAIAAMRGIYLFDDMDSLVSPKNDSGEVCQIMNSFLDMVEKDDSSSVFILVSKRPTILGFELARRVENVIEFSLPKYDQIVALLKSKQANYPLNASDWESTARLAEGLSQAEIVRAIEEAAIQAGIDDRYPITKADIEKRLGKRKASLGR
ncbi:MAG: ATP-binding protein [Methylococcaceae bacterium]|nr:ATP-binding protein [Methylococcaceae bacterium]